MITNSDITLFNARLDKESRRDKYIPTVIKGVSAALVFGTSGSFDSMSNSKSARVRIPINAYTDGKTYVDANTYSKMDDEEAMNHWTIQNSDVFVNGEVHPDDEIFDPSLLSHLYGDVFTVNSFADNTTRGIQNMRHWRIGGV